MKMCEWCTKKQAIWTIKRGIVKWELCDKCEKESREKE